MTPKELNILVEEVKGNLEDKLLIAKDLQASGVRNRAEYPAGTLKIHRYKTEQLDDYDNVDGLIAMLLEEREHIDTLKDNIAFQEFYDLDAYGDGEIEANSLAATWYEVIPEVLDTAVSAAVKQLIKEKLKPASAPYAYAPDCKLLGLFKDGVITWEALQKLTYTDCGL